jgi:ssRNA-specific RNase YbeY (16S rRNA maturation enzyme)
MNNFDPIEQCPHLTIGPLTWQVMIDEACDSAYAPVLSECLDCFTLGWPVFQAQMTQFDLLSPRHIDIEKSWEADLIFVTNETMRAMNETYRHKPSATDVLTFTLYADAPDHSVLSQLPVHHLGSVMISLDWAGTETGITTLMLQNDTDLPLRGNSTPTYCFIMYILERVVHGCLHLLGVTHDTESDYNKVVEIQSNVIDSVKRQLGTPEY